MEVEKSMLAEETLAKGQQTGGGAAPTASSGVQCFDCNICLQPVAQPVVTLCGHLYCWPCVYRWLRSDQPGANQCPVCKAAVSEDGLVPLYGRGTTTDAAKCNGGIQIPSHPSAASVEHRRRPPQDDGYDLYSDFQPLPRYRHQEHLGYYYNNSGTDYPSWPTVFQSNAGCLIGSAAVAVLPWAFRGGQTPLLTATPLRYDDWMWTPRQRQVERWLHQMWLWLVLFVLLCFLLF